MKSKFFFSVLSVVVAGICLTSCANSGSSTPDEEIPSNESEFVFADSSQSTSNDYPTEIQKTDSWEFQYSSEAGGIIITECLCANKRSDDIKASKDTDIVVPDSFDGFDGVKVVGIGERAFFNRIMKSLTLPDTITSIGKNAFNSADIADTLIIPNSVTSIGEEAFKNYWGEAVVLPPLEAIGGRMFMDANVKKVTLSEGTKVLTNLAFYDCMSLTDLDLPNSIEEISENSLTILSSKLSSITLPDNLKTFDISGLPLVEYTHYPVVTFKNKTYDFPAAYNVSKEDMKNLADELQSAINSNT